MKIVILGAGSIIPTASRFGSGIYVRAADSEILLDCGPGAIEKMRRLSISPFRISAVCLTHFHIDHVSDLPALLKLRAFNLEGLPDSKPKELMLLGPKGLNSFLKTLIDNNEFFSYVKSLMRYDSYCKTMEVEPWKVYDLRDVKLISAPVSHDGGVAYRLSYRGLSLAYSGDTMYDVNMVRLAEGVDVLIHECSFPQERLVGKHVSEAELARIVAETRPKTLVVTHLYPIWERQLHRLAEAIERSYRCRVVVAHDGLELNLEPFQAETS